MKLKRLHVIFLIFLLIVSFMNFSYAVDFSALTISSPVAILMESSNGKIIYEKSAYEKMFPASTTKVMTAVLVLENCNLNDIVTASYSSIASVPQDYSDADLQVDEQLSVKDLLYMMLMHSANDVANVLAEYVAGSIDSFSTMMNTKATELGCINSHFTNPSGIHDDEHYSCAYDLALITKHAIGNATFRSIVSTATYSVNGTNKHAPRALTNTNALLQNNSSSQVNYYYSYATGVKTGYTSPAKECLIATAKKDDLNLIVVILGSDRTSEDGFSQRFDDCIELFNFGFDNYTNLRINNANDIVQERLNFITEKVDLIVSEDINLILEKGKNIDNPSSKISIKNDLQFPIAKDTIVGSISYDVDGYIYSANLLSKDIITEPSLLFVLARIVLVLLILIFVFYVVNKKLYTKKKR